jgi:glutathione S-transferase
MWTLYYVPDTGALAPHIALEEAGAKYEAVRMSFKTEDQHKPEYRAINPKARVPSLVTERGVLTEVPAILAFVAQEFPEAKLAPLDDPFAFAEVQAFNSYLCSSLHVAHAHRMRGYRWADEPEAIAAMKRKVPQSVGEGFELIEQHFFKGPWVMGERYSICDPYLYTLAQWMEADGVGRDRFPKIKDHFRRMAERSAVKRALAAEAA